MSVPVTLLGLLERQPSHGYELKREYDAYFGRSKPLPFGQVYATLSRLVRDNKVEPGGEFDKLPAAERPDATYFVKANAKLVASNLVDTELVEFLANEDFVLDRERDGFALSAVPECGIECLNAHGY